MNSNGVDKIEIFWKIFESVMGGPMDRQCHSVISLEAWDSLTHVELIFELERELDIEFSQDDIAKLYSSTDAIIKFINSNS